jgi:hypothetical protein
MSHFQLFTIHAVKMPYSKIEHMRQNCFKMSLQATAQLYFVILVRVGSRPTANAYAMQVKRKKVVFHGLPF